MYCPETDEPCVNNGFECPYFSHIACATAHEMYGSGSSPIERSSPIKHVPQDWIDRHKQKQELKGLYFSVEVLCSMPYSQYLLTPHWNEISKAARKRAKYTCQKCGQKPGKGKLHVHHLTYINRGNEQPEDLQVLCENCHKQEHQVDE